MPKLDTIVSIKPEPDDKGRRKGIVRPRIEDEPWRRRSRVDVPHLKVFDVGQLVGGADSGLHEWIRDYSTPYTVFNLGGGQVRLVATVEPDTLAQQTLNWNTEYLSIDYNDWPDTFQEVTADLSDYEVQVTGFDQYNPARGLWSSTDANSIAVIGTAPHYNFRDKWFYSFPFGGVSSRSVKYTNTPSYGAASVSFTFDKDCDLFLVPVAFGGWGLSFYSPGGFTTYCFEYPIVQRPLSRSKLNDAGLENYWDNKDDHGSIDASGRSFLREYFINDAEGVVWRCRSDGGPNPQPIDADSPVFLPGTAFPEAGEGLGTPTINIEGRGLFAGKLAGAIRKHLGSGIYEWYFIWSSNFWQIPDSANLIEFEI